MIGRETDEITKDIPGWIKKRDNKPWKYDDKNFQYPATVELNYKKLK